MIFRNLAHRKQTKQKVLYTYTVIITWQSSILGVGRHDARNLMMYSVTVDTKVGRQFYQRVEITDKHVLVF